MMDSLDKKTVSTWQSCGFYKSNEQVHVNYEFLNVWPKFTTIDNSDFEFFSCQSCLNLLNALKHIIKSKVLNLQKLSNELAQNFKIGLKSGFSVNTPEVDLNGIEMIDEPPIINNQERDKLNFLERASNRLRELFKLQTKSNSKHSYKQEEFAAVIIKFIQWRSTINSEWKLIFNQVKFVEKISELVENVFYGKNSFDHELIQTLILKIDGVFAEYNNDFKVLGLSLSQEAMSFAHKIAFRKIFEIFTDKKKKEAYNVKELWEAKHDEFRQFSLSQLAPEENKDEINAKRFIRKFVESIDHTINQQKQTLIKTKEEEIESEFTHLKFQEKRDASLETMTDEDLLNYVLEPTKLIQNDFERQLDDLKSSLNREFYSKTSEQLNLFDELQTILKRLDDNLVRLENAPETFKAQELFRTTQLETQIENNVYLKVSNSIRTFQIICMLFGFLAKFLS